LNTVINETYELVKSTLSNLQIECELDLENDLPSVVSNQKHLKQVATNIFSLIKRKAKKGSGLLIQTRSVNDVTILSFFLTDYWPEINSNADPMVNLTVRIVKEVMKKNEGVADFESLPMKGTTIHLLFPLKRK
jgi:nitrogen-specific signal transduction histidine kinase